MKRRELFAASLALGTLATIGRSRAQGPQDIAVSGRTALPGTVPHLVPIRAHADQITDIKVCLRPFRPMGPRLDVEQIGSKTVVHNYGHGGSGWSLSWGSASIAVGKAATLLERRIGVIGCGIIGLTTALTAQRAGFDVTIYARDLLPHTRSARANGSWTPDSRIALTEAAGPQFAALWEQMARYSWKAYRDYLGLPGNPIEFLDYYLLSDTPPNENEGGEAPNSSAGIEAPARGDYATTGMPQSSAEFAEYGERIQDIIPAAEYLAEADNPFPVAYGRRAPVMIYNFGGFGHLLLSEFHQAGGTIVIRDFHSPLELTALPEPVLINCPGYAAHDWWSDKTLIPVRGQTAWLPPQPDARYGVRYRGAALLSKTDGVMIQDINLSGLGDMQGVGNSFEHPDRTEAAAAITVFEDLFTHFPVRKG